MRLLTVLLFISSVAFAGPSPERIISLSPAVTEILSAIGAFDRVVAVSNYCEYPPEVDRLPRVGGWLNTNLEHVAGLEPDLTIMTDAQAPFVKDRLESLGLRTLVVPAQSLDDIFRAIEMIGRAVGNLRQGEALIRDTRSTLDEIRGAAKNLPRPSVLMVVDRLPGTLRDLYVATQGSFLVEIIEIAGGRPITPPSALRYSHISTEAVVSLDPEVILDVVQALDNPVNLLAVSGELGEDPVAVWKELANVRAVRDHKVYALRDNSLVHPSHFVGETALEIARLLHPEVFQD
jgi:iron complex transport system substrate-binding protein